MSINVQILYNGQDVTSSVIQYNREQHICDGIGLLDITLHKDAINGDVWDTIVLYEDGNKKGTYIVSSVDKTHDGHLLFECQDFSKKLVDYFIPTSTELDYETNARYWIEQTLIEAGVSYSFSTASVGAPVAKNTLFGLKTAYEQIMNLLQQSGWYIYFDENSVAHIGEISTSTGNYSEILTSDEILSLKINSDDRMLRNRAVIWGAPGVTTDISVHTPWNYSTKDLRAVVLANSGIPNTTVSNQLATDIIKEFARLTIEKTVDLAGSYDLNLGDSVFIKTDTYSGKSIITTISSNLSKNGHITTLILDQRCPRLFRYVGSSIDTSSEPVYVGTNGLGIWKKPIEDDIWTTFNSGLENLVVLDLMINNGVFVCVCDDGYAYTRDITDTSWTKFNHGIFGDDDGTAYNEEDVTPISCTINKTTNQIFVGYRHTGNQKSWIVEISHINGLVSKTQIRLSDGNYNNTLMDIDTDDKSMFATMRIGQDSPEAQGICGETFTTNSLDDYSRKFDSNEEKYHTNPIICENRIYYASQLQADPTKTEVVVVDTSVNPPTFSYSSELTLTGRIENVVLYDDNTLYLVSRDPGPPVGDTTYVYKYTIDIDDLVFMHSKSPVGYAFSQYKNVLYWGKYLRFYNVFTNDYVDYGVPYPGLSGSSGGEGFNKIAVVWVDETRPSKHSYDRTGPSHVGTGCDANWVDDQQAILYDGRQYTSKLKYKLFDIDSFTSITGEEDITISETTHYSVQYRLFGICKNYQDLNLYAGVISEITDNGWWYCNSHPSAQTPPWPCNHAGYSEDSGVRCKLAGPETRIEDRMVVNLNTGQVWEDVNATEVDIATINEYVAASIYSIGGVYIPKWTGVPLGDTRQGFMNINAIIRQSPTFKSDNDMVGVSMVGKMDYLTGHAYGIGVRGGGLGGSPLFYDLDKYDLNGNLLSSIYLLSETFLNVWTDHPWLIASSESTLAFKRVTRTTATPDITRYYLHFFQFGDWSDPGFIYVNTRKGSGESTFSTVDVLASAHDLDISNKSLISTFPLNYATDTVRTSETGTSFRFQPLIEYGVGDLRSLYLSPESSLTTTSGIYTVSGISNLLAPSEFELKIIDPLNEDDENGWENFYTHSGEILKVETSNFIQNPYIFIAISGGQFLQRQLNVQDTFVEYTGNLPSVEVTVIRLDDGV